MPIRPPAGGEIRRLIDALAERDEVNREAAIARLAVIGPRAFERLLQEFESAPPRAKAGMLRVLEAARDPRALPVARTALDDTDQDVVIAAVGTLCALFSDAQASNDAIDALYTVAFDKQRPVAIRVATIEALRDAPPEIRDPIYAGLSSDSDPSVHTPARAFFAAHPPGALWRDMIEGRLGQFPSAVKTAVIAHHASARLTELQHLVDHVRAREQQETDPAVREEWRAVRGAVHQALAARGSRLALYDLRDSLLSSERLPVAFLAAIEEIGDASCLEPLAAAYEESSRSGDPWWREHVLTAFRAIVQREGITRRHTVLKRLMSRSPDAASELMGGQRPLRE